MLLCALVLTSPLGHLVEIAGKKMLSEKLAAFLRRLSTLSNNEHCVNMFVIGSESLEHV